MTWTKFQIFQSKQQRTFCSRYGFLRGVASYHVSIGAVFNLLFFQINDIFVLFLSHRLVFGTLYPAYSSYKAIKTKNVKEYVRNVDFVSCLHTYRHILLYLIAPAAKKQDYVFIWVLTSLGEDQVAACNNRSVTYNRG